MSEVIKMSKDEIDRLKKLQEDYNKKTFEFGRLMQAQIEIDNQRLEWEEQRSRLTEKYLEIQKQEIELAKELENKYGEGKVDLETEEFKKD